MKHIILIALVFATAALGASDKLLSEAALPLSPKESQTVRLFSSELQLKLQIGDGTAALLATQGFAQIQGLHPQQPLEAQTFTLNEAPACLLTFAIVDELGTVRSVGIALLKRDAKWSAVHEWSVDSGSLGEMGFRRETQKFAANASGILQRQARRLMVEGVQGKLDCGCTVCDARSTDVIEDETYQWRPATGTFERTALEKRYVVQQGEGMLAVARKALGDARLMARIYRLNPELKNASVLQPGQQILIERQ